MDPLSSQLIEPPAMSSLPTDSMDRVGQNLPRVTILDLPVETLSDHIFHMLIAEYINECDKSVYSEEGGWTKGRTESLKHPLLRGVRHVCRSWYHAASASSVLWKHILITPFIAGFGEESSGRREALQLAKLQLELSGSVPITLHLKPMYNFAYEFEFESEQQQEQEQMKYHALYMEQAPRCKTLSIEFTPFMFRQFQESLTSCKEPFPILETLTIDVPKMWDESRLQIDSVAFPKLRHLHINNKGTPIDASDLPDISIFHTFTLRQRGISPNAVKIIEKLKNAKSITMSDVYSRASRRKMDRIAHVSPCRLPFLEKLLLKGWVGSPKNMLGQFEFPSLRVLKVEYELLQDLYDGVTELIKRSECTLEVLKIKHDQPDYRALKYFLEDDIVRKIPFVFITYHDPPRLETGDAPRDEELRKIKEYIPSPKFSTFNGSGLTKIWHTLWRNNDFYASSTPFKLKRLPSVIH